MDCFVGEIRIFGCNYVPEGWLACDGSTLAVSQYTPLFAVIGNKFGGDGKTTFAVPNLQSRAVMGPGKAASGGTVNRQFSTAYGAKQVTLTAANLPPHNHILQRKHGVYSNKTSAPSANSDLANYNPSSTSPPFDMLQNTGAPNAVMASGTVGAAGLASLLPVGISHPYVVFNFGICYDGLFPRRDD